MSFGSRQALLRGLRRLGLTGLDFTTEPGRGVRLNGSGFPVLGSALRSVGIESGVEGTGMPAKSQGKADEPSALRASRLVGTWSWNQTTSHHSYWVKPFWR